MTEQKIPNTASSGLPRLRSKTIIDYLAANKKTSHSEKEYRRALAEGLKRIVADENPRVVRYFLANHSIDDVLNSVKVPRHLLNELHGAVTLYELLSAQIKKNKDYARIRGMDYRK